MEPTNKHDAAAPPSNAPEASRAIVAEAEEGIVILAPDGMAEYVNPAAEFLLGRGRSDLVGEIFDLPRAVGDGATKVNVISADGRVRLVELRVEPLPTGPDGSLVVRLKDVTDYHQDVARAREQVRRRDEFLAMLSHEVRNPLAAIRMSALLLARDDLGPERRRVAAEVCDRQFRHLDRILADLLDVTRISQGKVQITKERVDLSQVVRDALDEVAPLVAGRRHRLRVDVPPHPVWVDGDITRLGQVVVNLLKNAAKFTPPEGNISLIVSAQPAEVEICVQDDGPGIPGELLPHVFEPFVQGSQTLARSDGGLGIGLALVRTFVHLHGGTVSVRPNPEGPGVCFTVRLPAAEGGPAPEAAAEGAPPRPLRILLVEDGEDTRRALKRLLELDGHEVAEAADGPAGLAALLDGRPDVALVDIGLPGLDGYDVARRARQDPRCRDVRLIAVTGYGMPQDVEAARAAGFDGHLVKPLRYPDLCRLLREPAAGGRCQGARGP